MERKIKFNKTDRIINITTNNLIIKSGNGEQFSVPEYLVENIKVCDLPDEISIFPYQYFDLSGKTMTYHVPVIISKDSNTSAYVSYPEQIGMERWYPKGGGKLYPKGKRELILKHTSFKPDVYFFSEECDFIDMEYSIIVPGITVKDVIEAGDKFDREIEEEVSKMISTDITL